MPKITYITANGQEHVVEAQSGMTVMEVAVKNLVPGIEAECGGACSCATCHVYIDVQWTSQTGAPDAMEEDMLDFAFDVRETSRLSCQVKITDEHDGLIVHVPKRQF